MTKIDKMEQTLANMKEQLDDLYEGQEAIKDMIRQLASEVVTNDDEWITFDEEPMDEDH